MTRTSSCLSPSIPLNYPLPLSPEHTQDSSINLVIIKKYILDLTLCFAKFISVNCFSYQTTKCDRLCPQYFVMRFSNCPSPSKPCLLFGRMHAGFRDGRARVVRRRPTVAASSTAVASLHVKALIQGEVIGMCRVSHALLPLRQRPQ